MGFEIGQRVRVVRDKETPTNIGLTGRVTGVLVGDTYPYNVVLDVGRLDIFGDDDLALLNITVIEGVATKTAHTKVAFNGDWLDNHFEQGKRYRITIEEV